MKLPRTLNSRGTARVFRRPRPQRTAACLRYFEDERGGDRPPSCSAKISRANPQEASARDEVALRPLSWRRP
jgi:hypothetical protein